MLFCPQHLAIVRQGPSERRAFVDAALTQLSPTYIRALQKYIAQLNERNTLIKNYFDDPRSFTQTVGVWSEGLAESGALIALKRFEYVERLNSEIEKLFADMTGGRENP